MPSKTIIDLPSEVLINIFAHMNGTGIHDIAPEIFQAVEVCDIWKFVIYYVLSGVRPEEGFTRGFDYYLYSRLTKLRQISADSARAYNNIQTQEDQALEVFFASRGSTTMNWIYGRNSQPIMTTGTTTTQTYGAILTRYNQERKRFVGESEKQRNEFTEETKKIFAFQRNWGGRRNSVRGDEWNDWVWAHIVDARIQSDLCEQEGKTRSAKKIEELAKELVLDDKV